MMGKIRHPVMRYHGGKFRLAPWIISFFPSHIRYIEPFGGAAGVFVQKPKSKVEIYNDIDSVIVNVFRVLRCKESRDDLIERLVMTPYARDEFESAYDHSDDPVDNALRTLIRASMGFSSAGATKGKTGFRSDSRRTGISAHIWSRYPDQIRLFGERFDGVIIENRDALKVIEDHADDETLTYLDPPYVFDSRSYARHKQKYYRHEMTDDDHLALLSVVNDMPGSVVLSGYPSDIYFDTLSGWDCFSTEAKISSNRGTSKKTEVVWLNKRCAIAQRQQRLIA